MMKNKCNQTAVYSLAAAAAAAAAAAMLIAIAFTASATATAAVNQKEYGMKLLAVSETGHGQEGVTANLYLRLSPGTGNVFIEAEPVTKLDTRISLKLAKEIACESLPAVSAKCGSRDFFFRIEANASLVGGPSAGAAAAALTIAGVDDASISQSVAVTGTINSGGFIGQVGGLKEKIDAAAKSRLPIVLIPSGEHYYDKRTSKIDMVEYGKSVGVEVREVSDIREALLQLTGKNYSEEEKMLEIDKHYADVMENLAVEICDRSTGLSAEASGIDVEALSANHTENLKQAKDLASEGIKKKENGNYYSAASMCFGANVKHSYLLLFSENLSSEDALLQINKTATEASQFESEIQEAKTIAALQTRGAVMERLDDTRQLLKLSAKDLRNGDYNSGIYRLAFANERLGSARAWNRFLTSYQGAPLTAAYKNYNESLRKGCTTRLQEADEHIQYLDIYLPGLLKSSEELGPVYSYLRQGYYTSCIYKASLAKAKANAMLSALSGNENLTKLIDQKLKAAKQSIVRQTREGDFPIISYSYYEYSGSLKDTDQPSALLYSEYALELSSLKAYLNHNQKAEGHQVGIAAAAASGFAAGALAASALAFSFFSFWRKPRKKLLIKVKN